MRSVTSVLSFSLPNIRLIHEVVKDRVVFHGQDVHHIVELEVFLVDAEQAQKLIIVVIEYLGQEAIEVSLDYR